MESFSAIKRSDEDDEDERLRRCATAARDRERDRALKNRSKSCDRTRRPLSESAMTFGPFMAWDKSRPHTTSSRNPPISLSYRYRYDTAASSAIRSNRLDYIIRVIENGKKLYEKSKRKFRSLEKYLDREISRLFERPISN